MDNRESATAQNSFRLADENRRALILSQLDRIRKSPAFRKSDRAKRFLSYVVEHALLGQVESLKERTIGVELFHRSPTYLTGDDAIVRITASEVRRRLAQYYAEEERTPEVRIEIPTGSYIPEFHWGGSANSTEPPGKSVAVSGRAARSNPRMGRIALVAICLTVLGLASIPLLRTAGKQVRQRSISDEFWAPVFSSEQPVLICFASPVVYYPSPSLFARAGQAHPGPYDTPLQRANTLLQLDSNAALKWKDMEPRVDIFVNKDDACVAADLSELFARIHKTSQVRIGHDFSYDDLRHSPTVLVGAFDNPWTVRMASELPFFLQERDSTIQERGGQGRIWSTGEGTREITDFYIVARLLNSKTGQFIVILAGIGMAGTQAAGVFVSRESALDAGFKAAPTGWQGKNLEMVVESEVIDGAAGRSRVLAATVW